MSLVQYIVVAVAVFFAAGWTIGYALNPNFRLKSTSTTICLWCCAITFVLLGKVNAFNLLWIMPALLIVPSQIALYGFRRDGIGFGAFTIFMITSVIYFPALFFVMR